METLAITDCPTTPFSIHPQETELVTPSIHDDESAITKLENIDVFDEQTLESMSVERRSWVEYRLNNNPDSPKKKRKRVVPKLVTQNLTPSTTTSKRRTSRNLKNNAHTRSMSVGSLSISTMNISPLSDQSVTKYEPRPANIYEDENGGKRRRPCSQVLKHEDGFMHTPISEIERKIQKQRGTPDYASSDSGLGLLSPPYGSRTSESPEYNSPDIIKPSDLMKDLSMNDFDMGTLPRYDSSDDESSRARNTVRKNARIRVPTKKSLLSQALTSHKMSRHAQPVVEHQDSDYTDFSDLEPDSDTPVYELLVDSEDEEDHKRRKLARRQRKAEKRQRLSNIHQKSNITSGGCSTMFC